MRWQTILKKNARGFSEGDSLREAIDRIGDAVKILELNIPKRTKVMRLANVFSGVEVVELLAKENNKEASELLTEALDVFNGPWSLCFRMLLRGGVTVDLNAVMFKAARCGRFSIVKSLVAAGANDFATVIEWQERAGYSINETAERVIVPYLKMLERQK